MARSTKGDTPKRGVQRRRSGCWACKSRKIKCDERQPACSTCVRLGGRCSYGLRLLWQDEAASRGIALGRTGVWKKRRPGSSSSSSPKAGDSASGPPYALPLELVADWMFLNVTCQDFEEAERAAERRSDGADSQDGGHLDRLAGDDTPPPASSSLVPPLTPAAAQQPGHGGTTDGSDLRDGPAWMDWSETMASFFLPPGTPSPGLASRAASDLVAPASPMSSALFSHASSLRLSPLLLDTPPLLSLNQTECLLLDFFASHIALRWCPSFSPDYVYLTHVWRLAVDTAAAGERLLLDTLIAVAANQLRILDDHRFDHITWEYRGRSLRMLQKRIQGHGQQQAHPRRKRRQQEGRMPQTWSLSSSSSWEDILATVLMLCFFDVSDRCHSVWKKHLLFARVLRQWPQLQAPARLSPDQRTLVQLFSSYFASHEILARTAAELDADRDAPSSARDSVSFWMPPGVALDNIDMVTGMSHELLQLLAGISDLARERRVGEKKETSRAAAAAAAADFVRKRDALERRLHSLRQKTPPRPWHNRRDDGTRPGHAPVGGPVGPVGGPRADTAHRAESSASVAESKRLCALLYLYVRLDDAQPPMPHVQRLVARILALLPRIGVGTNTILWPLFVVGTMGVQAAAAATRDADKRQVLELFHQLQCTRQLGNVKRARRIVEAVWRRRELRGDDSVGWAAIEEMVLRADGVISLC